VLQPVATTHLPALLKQFLDLGMDMEIARVVGEAVADFLHGCRAEPGVHLVFRLVGSADVVGPIAGKLGQRRTLLHLGGLLLRFCQRRLELLDPCRGIRADLLGVELIQCRMRLDFGVAQGLGDGGIVDLAVPVAAVTDQVDDHIGVEGVTVFHSQGGDTHGGVGILRIHVEDGDGEPLADVGGVVG
jgi:hypothetical protein